ncbi:ABC transporter substrate-binding protein [Paenibacillus mucilaginosus]|uniref:Extracellular solute-binding protein, family 1 n=1 Tax=Paenibacillus mucilaginosus (strain KNP414) TaxID=1036673 RepID=F8F6G4_PAEMK|nr:sugar ABC transporter substrate-binding protein [Paenibacillus mucilaginosus]AEI42918.1 extracellular solute-binding protein, family 1 [Paenibacillus mucilaginosus KNP414]MCG7216034.1 sugar ABC transporter substrate-binding protein [Paenibacillus mucilaginosus]WDM24564.1 sugar ABC transporter substrate-binding protein [Paenibacillus mucilaginosus]
MRIGRKPASLLLISTFMLLAACGGDPSTGSGSQPAAVSEPSSTKEGKSEGKDTVALRIMWWGSQARHDATNKVIDLFEQKNPHIQVSAEYLGADGYWDKLNTLVAGGNAPDIIQLGNNYPDYVSRGTLLELDPYIGKPIDLGTFDEQIASTGKLDGKQYGVNMGSNALSIVYNTELIKKAGMEPPKEGWTWEEMEAYSKQLVGKLGKGYYAFADQSGFTHYLGHYVRQNGKALYNGSEIVFDEALGTKWFEMWNRFRQEGIIPTAAQSAAYLESTPDNSLLVEGKLAMLVIWSNQFVAFQKAMKDELQMIPLPAGGSENGMWIQPSQFMTINKNSKHPQEAAQLLNFFVNDPEATLILGSDRGIPGSTVVRDALKANADPITLKTYNYLDVAVKHSREMDREMPNIQEWDTALRNSAQKLAFGKASAADAAAETVKAAVAAVSKSKSKS